MHSFGRRTKWLLLFIPLFLLLIGIAYAEPYYQYATYNCTWVAWIEAKERLGIELPQFHDAKDWFENAKKAGYPTGDIPLPNSIACYGTDAYATYGHVQYVTAVSEDGEHMDIIDGGHADKARHYQPNQPARTWNAKGLQGFIYLDHANLGDEFYGVILHKDSWKPINADPDTHKITLEYESGTSKQLWKFKRQSDGAYVISSCNNGLALEMYYGTRTAGTQLEACAEYWGGFYQQWYIIPSGDGYIFKSKHYAFNDWVMELKGGNTAYGTAIQINKQTGKRNQIFDVYKGNDIQLRPVSLSASTDGAKVTFSWAKVYGANYNLKIWKDKKWDGELYKDLRNVSSGVSVTLPAGTYEVYVDSVNYYNYVMSNVVTLKITPKEYTVTFNSNGGTGTINPQKKIQGVDLTLTSAKPTKTGFSFLGWATSNSATTAQYSPGGKYTKDAAITLYAVWKPIQYTIKYDANGGGGIPDPQTKIHGTNLTLSSKEPTRTGYNFLGWATSSSAKTAQYTAGATFTANANTTLYAVWEIQKYTIAFNANGGTGAPGSQIKTYGTDLTLSSVKPSKKGYSFQGWATTASATTVKYAAGAKYTANANATLYAVWKIDTYKLQYNANGGTGTLPATVTVNYNETVTVERVQVTRKGYYFLGWATTASATSAQYKSGASIVMTGNVTLYAVWQAKLNKITFDLNEGEGTVPSTLNVKTGATGTIGKANVSRLGYYFLGWATSSDATAATYKTGSTISVSEDTKLYAVWKPRLNKITFDANEGKGTLPNSFSVATGKTGTIGSCKMSREGYYFLGWSTSSTATSGTYKTGSSISVCEDTVLYAVWKKKK
ncbi:MAG: InlB B-repeat-containing protein [Lachnospiraceae bacterium]|nr:InlB B-repeat-containing protein [Lachnospiraceae bacterium]